eukprot:GHUV01054982.1.p1 GENE.GHUV01054982.1~~GHUV01054982.1.p1  ORF type:complete len:134 (+),score=33.50 GHUV01054982.1:418-819(+)
MHASYYYRAQACIMVFDVTRKITYKNLENWYQELQQHAKGIPTLVVANKIDIDYQVTSKSFKFAEKYDLPFYFVSASDGTNVVRIFHKAILEGGTLGTGHMGHCRVVLAAPFLGLLYDAKQVQHLIPEQPSNL